MRFGQGKRWAVDQGKMSTTSEKGIVAGFARAGYLRVEPAILQPLEPFLDLSGEDIRRRMFITQDGEGRERCLRPEYTIPVAIIHLLQTGRQAAGRTGSYCYAGPVFRLRSGEPGEFAQGGLESFGREDRAAADAEIMALTIEAVAAEGLAAPVIRMGDAAILGALLNALEVPDSSRRRLLRAIARGDAEPLRSLDAPVAADSGTHAGLIAALEGQDPKAARAFVQDVLSIAGISSVGGRSAGDIAERFLAKAAEKDNAVSPRARSVLAAALAVNAEPDLALASLREIEADAGIDLWPCLDQLEERIGFLASRGVAVEKIRFSVGFARNLDYYSGHVFELLDPADAGGKPVAGGGRYDGLLQRLGAVDPVPAVGASIWLDRLAHAASAAQDSKTPDGRSAAL
jgi:ATP phosphoribosyltransferase regulatory subunit